MTALTAELRADFDGLGRPRIHTSGPLELRGPLAARKLYYLRNVTAGIFGGDTYSTAIHCAESSSARVGSSSAAKVYSMPHGAATTTVDLIAERGSCLIWGPHSTILHTDSALRQETRVTLHEGARVIIAETLVMGRIAAGQRFDFASYASRFVVQDATGRALYREAYELQPGPDLEAAMGGLAVLTTVYALGAIPDTTMDYVSDALACRQLAGISRLPNDCGIVVKALTASLSGGAAIARECLAILDAEATPAAAPPPRPPATLRTR
jgi:urease accessory protein